MAKSVDAADLKSAGLAAVPVRVRLRAPRVSAASAAMRPQRDACASSQSISPHKHRRSRVQTKRARRSRPCIARIPTRIGSARAASMRASPSPLRAQPFARTLSSPTVRSSRSRTRVAQSRSVSVIDAAQRARSQNPHTTQRNLRPHRLSRRARLNFPNATNDVAHRQCAARSSSEKTRARSCCIH